MKIVLAILQGLLLQVLSEEAKCRKEAQRSHYYIYNANVSIKVYACIFEESVQCDAYIGRTVQDNSQNIVNNCFTHRFGTVKYKKFNSNLYSISYYKVYLTLCEIEANVNLLENSIRVNHFNELYSKGYIKTQTHYITWTHNVLKNLERIYNGFFDVWTLMNDQRKYINNTKMSLLLTEKIKYWPFVAWKTEKNGIVVSTSDIYTLTSKNVTLRDQSILPADCGHIRKTQEDSTDICLRNPSTNESKTLYIYECSTNATVYYCVPNPAGTCEKLGLEESVGEANLLNRCMYHFFDGSSCVYQNLNIAVCKKELKVDPEGHAVEGLSSDCKYSDGLCRRDRAFWFDSCKTLGSVDRPWYSKGRCVIKFNNTELTVTKIAKFRGAKVWYTDKSLTISEKMLQLRLKSNSMVAEKFEACVNYLTNVLFERNEEIDNFRNLFHYMIFAVVTFVLWYIFNVMVNFYSLWTVGRARNSKNCAYLMNCVSQSLTNRYLYKWSSEKGETKRPSSPELYGSTENELYGKVS